MFTTRRILAIYACVIGAFAATNAAVAADGETRTLINNAFHEYASSTCDSSAFTCMVTFPPSAFASTVIKAVSCDIHVSFGSNLGFKLSTITGYESFYMPGSVFLAGGDLEVTSNASAYLFVNKGDTPAVIATVQNGTFTGVGTLSCTIAGEHS
jgi:hypothetical protein